MRNIWICNLLFCKQSQFLQDRKIDEVWCAERMTFDVQAFLQA